MPRKSKIDLAVKDRAVEKILAGRIGLTARARELGVDHSVLKGRVIILSDCHPKK